MNCDICFAAFDNSIHKPYSIVSVVPNIDSSKSLVCLHTYCLSCWDQMSLTLKRCPKCNKLIKGKTLNTELLKQLPESEYDKIKDSSLKTFDESIINLNELKQSIKVNREQKLKQHETQIDLVKKTITDETLKLICYLKQNEENLLNECDQNLKELPLDLDSNKYENNVLFQIDLSSREKIVKNELSKDELNELTNKIAEIKEKLNATLNVVNRYEKPFNFIPNKISNDDLLIGQIKLELLSNNESEKVSNESLVKDQETLELEAKNESLEINHNDIVLSNLNKNEEEAIECFDKPIELNPCFSVEKKH